MKRRTKMLLRYVAAPIAAGLVVGSITSQLTMNYLDRKLEQMVVDTPPNAKAGVFEAVSAIEKNAAAPYQVIEITAPPCGDITDE